MNMKPLAVVTPLSMYHGCSTRKPFWEEIFIGKENFTIGDLSAVNMKHCGSLNVRKYRDIKSVDKYVSLDIPLKFDSLDKMIITSSESKVKLRRSGKGLITFMSLKAKTRSKKYKKARYVIVNVGKKDLSKIIKEFENHLMKVMIRRVPKMTLLTVTFAYQDRL